MLGIGFAMELGYTIAIPAVIFGIGGGLLDRQFHSSPLFLLAGLVLAFIISFVIIARKIRRILRRIPRDLPRKEKRIDSDPGIVREQEAIDNLFRPPTP